MVLRRPGSISGYDQAARSSAAGFVREVPLIFGEAYTGGATAALASAGIGVATENASGLSCVLGFFWKKSQAEFNQQATSGVIPATGRLELVTVIRANTGSPSALDANQYFGIMVSQKGVVNEGGAGNTFGDYFNDNAAGNFARILIGVNSSNVWCIVTRNGALGTEVVTNTGIAYTPNSLAKILVVWTTARVVVTIDGNAPVTVTGSSIPTTCSMGVYGFGKGSSGATSIQVECLGGWARLTGAA